MEAIMGASTLEEAKVLFLARSVKAEREIMQLKVQNAAHEKQISELKLQMLDKDAEISRYKQSYFELTVQTNLLFAQIFDMYLLVSTKTMPVVYVENRPEVHNYYGEVGQVGHGITNYIYDYDK